jgi:hypothetical protein
MNTRNINKLIHFLMQLLTFSILDLKVGRILSIIYIYILSASSKTCFIEFVVVKWERSFLFKEFWTIRFSYRANEYK